MGFDVVLCFVLLCYVVLCDVTVCYVVTCYAQYYTTMHNVHVLLQAFNLTILFAHVYKHVYNFYYFI